MSEDDGLQYFLSQAGGHRLLTAAEEKALGRRIQAGDTRARDELALSNIRLVMSVARYYRNRGLPMADVVQLGYIGLNRAAEKFDPNAGTRFSTYATLWIKQAIQRGLSSGGAAIRLPATVAASRAKVRSMQAKYPDADAVFLADLLDMDVREVERALDAAEVVTSLDREAVTDEHTHTMLDSMAWSDEWGRAHDPYAEIEYDLSDELREALDAMEQGKGELDRPRAALRRKVIEMHFGLTGEAPMSVEEIALKVKKKNGDPVSVNTVKALRAEGLAHLRGVLDTN